MWGTTCVERGVHHNLGIVLLVCAAHLFMDTEVCKGAVMHASGGVNGAASNQAIWCKKKDRVDTSTTSPSIAALVLNQMCASCSQRNLQSICCAPNSFFQKQITLVTNGLDVLF